MLRRELNRFRIAFSFLTTIPFPIVNDQSEKDQARSLIYAPIVGLFIGAVMLGIWQGLSFLPYKPISAILLLLLNIALTGGLHLDGLADTCDGVFSNRPRERTLEIMRDSHIGTNGVIALVLILMFYGVVFFTIPSFVTQNTIAFILLMPVAGRTGSVVASGISEYARKTDGLGKNFIELLGIKEALVGGALSLLIHIGVFGWRGAILFVITIISTLLMTLFFKHKLGGATGDTLGAICEINQVIFILGYIIIGGI